MPYVPAPDLVEALRVVQGRDSRRPRLALVLGSGLGHLAEVVEDAVAIPASALPGYPRSTVEGHSGELVLGTLEGQPVAIVRGRVHLYEGHAIRDVTFPVRLVHALGARRLLVTNAAGGINPQFRPGTLMFITDHINLGFANPLVGPLTDGSPRFPDMSAPYDPSWLHAAEALAREQGIATRRGVYLWTLGPSYETKAEIRYFGRIGADAVGMSTVPEVLQATALGLRVLGFSTITNAAAGLEPKKLAHEDVLAVSAQMRAQLEALVRAVVRSSRREPP